MKRTLKKSVSILLSLVVVVSLFIIVPLTADASSITGFFDCTSGSAEGYFFYSDHFYKVEWTGINTESTAKVQLCVANDCLYATVRGTTTYSNISIAFFRNATLRSNWTPSEIVNLIAGQSSSGYTNSDALAAGASARVYKKVCTITCVAANAPAWDWSDDFTACTATFTCADKPSLTKTVNASVSTEGYTATASVTFNSITYTETITIPGFSVNKAGDTYTIRSEEGWNTFCDCLQDNDTYNRFSGKTVVLEKNISVSRMAGSSHHDFCGTFEGNGKTLTFTSSENVNGTAPFSYVSETTPTGGTAVSHPVICNLNVVCDITTSATHASGLVGRMWGELTIENCTVSGTITSSNKYACGFIGEQNGTANITNCRSSVEINSSVTGDGTHGGFIGRTMNNTSTCIEGCVFDGKIVSTGIGDDATTSCGGFVGWRDKNGSLTITNSLYTPTADDNAVADGATFARNWTMPDNANCYYTRTLGTAQGKQAYTITAGDDVTLGLSGDATEYDVSGITAYAGSNGIKYGETTLSAGSGDTVTLTVAPSAVGYAVNSVSVNDGAVAVASNENGTYSFTMPASNAAVTAEFEEVSYFDASTGTLTLKGTIHNNNGIVLPDGVNEAAVLHINVDSSGATLPQDSSSLFLNFTNVTSIDLTGADTRNVTNMTGMFYYCPNLTELDLSSFDTSRVSDMNNMFASCRELKTLDLSSFDTSRVSDMNNMFLSCLALKTIYVSEQWSTESVTDSNNMFQDCEWLTGGNGTAFDLDYIDKTYAVIDKDGQPGYLTGVYTLTLPDHMEIVTDADENMKLSSRYLEDAVVTVKAKTGYTASNVKANGTDLTADGNGVYTVTVTENTVITALIELHIGDANLDGKVNIRDVTAIQRHLADIELLSEEQLAAADTNGDGEIGITDATHLQMYLAEYDVMLGKQPV